MTRRGRVTSLADRLHLDFALIHRDDAYKSRGLVNGGESNDSMDLLSQERLDAPFKKGVVAGAIGLTLVGNVVDRIAFILDDVIDSTSSFIDAAEQLISGGAKSVYVIATHGILSGNALAEIGACSSIHKVRTIMFVRITLILFRSSSPTRIPFPSGRSV